MGKFPKLDKNYTNINEYTVKKELSLAGIAVKCLNHINYQQEPADEIGEKLSYLNLIGTLGKPSVFSSYAMFGEHIHKSFSYPALFIRFKSYWLARVMILDDCDQEILRSKGILICNSPTIMDDYKIHAQEDLNFLVELIKKTLK